MTKLQIQAQEKVQALKDQGYADVRVCHNFKSLWILASKAHSELYTVMFIVSSNSVRQAAI